MRRFPSDRPRFRRLFRNLRRISAGAQPSRRSPARVRSTSERRCWKRSPGTASRVHDRGSGDLHAIRCDFGLAPVAKRTGKTAYSHDDSPRTHCSGRQSATGPWPQSGKAESAGRRITRCEAEDTSLSEPPEASPTYIRTAERYRGTRPLWQRPLRKKNAAAPMARLRIPRLQSVRTRFSRLPVLPAVFASRRSCRK